MRIDPDCLFFFRFSFLRCFLVLILLVSSVPLCSAATLYVSPTGDDNNAGTQAAPYKTIQDAVDNAADGDAVTLEDGTYSGIGDRDIDLKGKNITINSVAGASKTVIDCAGTKQDQHRAFYLHTKETAILHGIAIENGSNNEGGAMNIGLGCSVKLIDCAFMNNTAWSDNFAGGGAILNQGTADVINCTFTKNSAGGGAFGGAICSDGALTLTHCVVSGNVAGDGGALFDRGKATVSNSQFIGNKADGDGGAIDSHGTLHIADSIFSGNTLSGAANGEDAGGAIFSRNDTTLTNCVLSNNSAGDQGSGGAILSENILTLNDCTLSNNTARQGGGIATLYTGLDIIYLNGCNIISNSAVKGGGIYVSSGAQLTNCIIAGNNAHEGNRSDNSPDINTAEGGGLFNWYGTPQFKLVLRFCSFFGNSAQGPKGQGGAIENDGHTTLTNVILWGNDAANQAEIGTPANGNQKTTVTYSDIQGGLSGTGNLKTDPRFVDVAKADLHLQTSSPCRGAGIKIGPTLKPDPEQFGSKPDAGVSTDADAHHRPSPPSMGAYEYNATPSPIKKRPVPDQGALNTKPTTKNASSETSGAPAPDTGGIPTTNSPAVHPTMSGISAAGPQNTVALGPTEQKQANDEFLHLMVSINTNTPGHDEMVKQLQGELAKGAQIDARDGEGFPAIVTAASLKRTDVVQVLLELNADPNTVTVQSGPSNASDESSILHHTANGYQVDIQAALNSLFGHKSKPKSIPGQSALMFAAQLGLPDMVTLLLNHHVLVSLRDGRGKTAVDYATEAHHDDIAATLTAKL